MKKLLTAATLLVCFFANSQCKKEVIEKENYTYEGCLNYEGMPNGEGKKIIDIDGQIQTFTGIFKDGEFNSGEFSVIFLSGDKTIINYIDFENEYISNETYQWSNGNKLITKYEGGKKVKETKTNGPGDKEGLIIEKIFKEDKVIEIRNIDNNRVPEDIIGEEEYLDIDLIENNNQFRINIEFPKIDGDSFTVPIQFDSGATGFLIGNKLYQDLKSNCEIIDLNVKGKGGGVGSEFETKYVRIKEIKIGDYSIKNVVANVPLNKDINDILLGIGVLKKFKEVLWSLNSKKMRFYK